jgi:hypothetical protein
MKCNVGGADRTSRFVLGAALGSVGLFAEMSEKLRIGSFLVAAIAIGTAAVRYCPANSLLGVDTCRKAA